MDILPKIINFLWLCFHNSVPVRDVLANRGISSSNACLVCGCQGETIIHSLRECEFARFCWSKIQLPHAVKSSFNAELVDWLHLNCQSKEVIIPLYHGTYYFHLLSGSFGNTVTKFVLKIFP